MQGAFSPGLRNLRPIFRPPILGSILNHPLSYIGTLFTNSVRHMQHKQRNTCYILGCVAPHPGFVRASLVL